MPSAVRVGTRQSRRHRFLGRDRSFSLPRAGSALSKSFAECPTNGSRQRLLCRPFFPRVAIAECGTQQSLCRVYLGLCRVLQALGKAPESSSGTFTRPNNVHATERFGLACRDSSRSHTPTIHGVALLVVVLVTPSFRVLSDRAPDLGELVTRALISQSHTSLKGSEEAIHSRRTDSPIACDYIMAMTYLST